MLIKPGKLVEKVGFEKVFIGLVFILGFFVRTLDLGYSHYYGDEIKTLYLDKTVSASEFFLNQRKGPVQFFAVWVMEKISGGFSEGIIRLPFSLASSLSIIFFYLFVKKIFGRNAGYFSTAIYAFWGFSVAFARTAQYQSFLLLFGFASIYFATVYRETGRRLHLLASAFLLALSLYSHYDGIFFLIPIVFISVKDRVSFFKFLKFFLLPSLIFLTPFYLPYLLKGYMSSNTVNYISRRVSGSGYLENNSLYTISVYNPLYLFFMLMLPAVYGFVKKWDKNNVITKIWFAVTFVFYEIFISNPGTHIQIYLIPLIILSGVIMSELPKALRYLYGFVIALYMCVSFITFIPSLNTGYPWKDSSYLGLRVPKIQKTYQLFLYGFPYNRGWDQISKYFYAKDGVRGVYTNDNDSFGDYYLLGLNYTPPGTNFIPQYYIEILDNQEIDNPKGTFFNESFNKYTLEKEIFLPTGQKTANIYKLAD